MKKKDENVIVNVKLIAKKFVASVQYLQMNKGSFI